MGFNIKCVCPRTVRGRLLEIGLRGCKARPKPLLTEFQRKRRLTWAREHSLWTIKDWEKRSVGHSLLPQSLSCNQSEADFLRHYGWLVNIRHGCLVESLQMKGTVQQGNNSEIRAVNGTTKFPRLLAEFPSLVEAVSTQRKLKHKRTSGFLHATTTTSGQAQVSKTGVSVTKIRGSSSSCWASTLHMAPKMIRSFSSVANLENKKKKENDWTLLGGRDAK
ncbi:hypothetical protein TNCV_2632741 [Trichonephila clavipes]|nr:hypothetical protein TNCV_2632741 [Trichonephila clavipes]